METTSTTYIKKPKIKLDFKDSKYATGRRKKSIAKIFINKLDINIKNIFYLRIFKSISLSYCKVRLQEKLKA